MKIWLAFIIFSIAVHLSFGTGLFFYSKQTKMKGPSVAVKIKVNKVEKKPVLLPQPKEENIVKQERKPDVPKKVEEKKLVKKPKSERKPKQTPNKDAKPVQGLSLASFAPGGKTAFSAPIGNTLLKEDEGLRLKANEVQELEQDLSSDAALIRSTLITPEYTEDALSAALEGYFGVEVFVDKKGKVINAELEKKVGFNMDDRILLAVKNARFVPRKDKHGEPLDGWTNIKFKLEIP